MVLLLGGTCVPLDRSGARNLDMMAVANLHACDAFHFSLPDIEKKFRSVPSRDHFW